MNIVTTFVKKANSTLGLFKRILSGCTSEAKNTAYLTLVRPKLEYASSVWNPYTQCNVEKIEMVQCLKARSVYQDYSHFSHFSLVIKELGWDSFEHHRLFNEVGMFYRIYKGHVCVSLPAETSRNKNTPTFKQYAPFHQLDTMNDAKKYSFYPSSIRIWNSLSLSSTPKSFNS